MFIVVIMATEFFFELPRWIYYTYISGLVSSGLAAGITGLIAVIRKHSLIFHG